MKKNLLSLIICLFLSLSATIQSYGQVAAIPFTASLDTFSVISGTTVDFPMVDDVSYQGIPIGFTFNFGGANHDYMSINTNGYIQLDSTGTGSFYSILNGNNNNVVAPFGADLVHYLPNASLQYTTIGTAPNRICIIQWLHYSYFGNSGDVNVQLWLCENSNCIRFIYGANSFVNNPLMTQIGMRGTSNLDFQTLGDTACNWANAYPYPSLNTNFPVSLSCSMPSGFAFHWGACGNNNVNFYYLTGNVFNDLNGNGVRDTNETGMTNRMMNLNPGNYYVSTDAAGDYSFFFTDTTQSYTINTTTPVYWNFTTPSSISVNAQAQSSAGLNFGMQMTPNIREIAVTCPDWGVRPGQLEPMPISYQNNGTTTESDTITFTMDSLYSFVNATPAPVAMNGQTLQWTYTNLAPGQHGFIMLQLMPSSSAMLGDTLHSSVQIGPLVNDTVRTNNILPLHQLLTLAWDPNEKDVEPSGDIDAGTELFYTIHFQNTGNAAADNVLIVDTIDSNLDLLSFRLLGSSHNVNMTTEGSGIIHFTFYNIQLPDSGSDLAGSNGFVSYSMRAHASLPGGTVINNRAGIIFDTNIPIMTNTTVNTIRIQTGISGINSYQTVFAYPNPANSFVQFSFSENENELADLIIRSVDGKTVLVKNNIRTGELIPVNVLANGIYICTLKTKSTNFIVKIVKE